MGEKKKEEKRNKEIMVVREMIRFYCKRHHDTKELCPECQRLYDYAKMRVEYCPFMETKTFCSNCKVHCYKPQMREKIRLVMRYSGPRMLYYHPLLTIWHVICSWKEKNDSKKCVAVNKTDRNDRKG